MNDREAMEQAERITKYRSLEKCRNETRSALNKLTEKWEDGPCGQGPFTGNTRESRTVDAMHIWFSGTRGGAVAVDTVIQSMHIEAHELGTAIAAMLRAKIDTLNAEIEKV